MRENRSWLFSVSHPFKYLKSVMSSSVIFSHLSSKLNIPFSFNFSSWGLVSIPLIISMAWSELLSVSLNPKSVLPKAGHSWWHLNKTDRMWNNYFVFKNYTYVDKYKSTGIYLLSSCTPVSCSNTIHKYFFTKIGVIHVPLKPKRYRNLNKLVIYPPHCDAQCNFRSRNLVCLNEENLFFFNLVDAL